MVSINYSAREVCCKIVYYGPGLSGKTTNLQYVHQKVPGNTRGKLISLATEADRTLYFDFLPINIGTINGFQAKFQLYTVPGQVYYNATRKLVLRGCDGIVFVADSQPDKMDENIESLSNMEENLREYGYDPATMPIVIQYNKRDLPGVLPVEELNARLNTAGRPCFQASASIGTGVFDTLKLIIKLVLDKAKKGSTSGATAATAAAPATSPTVSAPPATATQPTRTATATAVAEPPVRTVEKSETEREAIVTSTDITPDVESEPVAPTPESPPARPFPGQERGGPRPFPGTGQQPAPHVKERPQLENTTVEPKSSTDSTPQMAPPLRKRRGQKKRGLFKRMFGIK